MHDPSWHQQKRKARMEAIDRMSSDQRALVHDYGFSIVYQFMCAGVTKPSRIRHLVELVLDEFSPTRGTSSNQGTTRAPGYKETAP